MHMQELTHASHTHTHTLVHSLKSQALSRSGERGETRIRLTPSLPSRASQSRLILPIPKLEFQQDLVSGTSSCLVRKGPIQPLLFGYRNSRKIQTFLYPGSKPATQDTGQVIIGVQNKPDVSQRAGGTRGKDISLTLKTSLFCLLKKMIMTRPIGGTHSSESASSSQPSGEMLLWDCHLSLPYLPNSYPHVKAHSSMPFCVKLIFTPQVE